MNYIEDFGVSLDKDNMRLHYWYKSKDKLYSNFRQISKEDIDNISLAIMELCSRFGKEIIEGEKIKKSRMVSYVSMVHSISREYI